MRDSMLRSQPAALDPARRQQMRQQVEQELVGNILPFWINHTCDEENGGFYGALTNDLQVLNDVPRSAVLCARVLWTFATAYQTYGQETYLALARRAYAYLRDVFWDKTYGGVYWLVDRHGQPVNDRKHSYAQGFALYGLSQYYAATHDEASLQLLRDLFHLLDVHTHDRVYGGYVEGRARDWSPAEDVRLSGKEANTSKSMNTLLHIMEPYTNMLRIWDDALLRARLQELIGVFLDHVIDPRTYHFKLYFDDQWNAPPGEVSYGHDIEGSWLLVEAAEVLGDPELLERARQVAVAMAQAVYEEGLDSDGSVLYEDASAGPPGTDKHWWVEAEALVGFYNAYQISGEARYAEESFACWDYIAAHFVDRQYGDWVKVLNRQGVPYADHYKVGPWECPYHHSRACFEMLRRLEPKAALDDGRHA